jgi:hypothetical protein
MHEWHVTLGRTPYLFSVYNPMWGSLLDYKSGDSGQEGGRAELKHELPPHVFSGSHTTTKYTDKQEVGLLSSRCPEPR